MSEQKNSLLDNLLGWIVGIPILFALLILCSPIILYMLVIKEPIHSFHRKAFLRRNTGKQILCISPGRKFRMLCSDHREEILSLGIHDVVVFDPTKSSNEYDGFEWDTMIARDPGFPSLIRINGKVISQRPLKAEFMSYFKKEIDWIHLKECVKRKVDGKNY